MEHIVKALTQIAISKAIPFCYACNTRAPFARCATCLRDDLMFELPNVGFEYGSTWLLREITREHLTPADTHEAFEQSVAECYPETVKIGWIAYDTVTAIKELDPVSWKIARDEWIDVEVSDGSFITFDNGTNYFWTSDRAIYRRTVPERSVNAGLIRKRTSVGLDADTGSRIQF
jgi:hypothetical protein